MLGSVCSGSCNSVEVSFGNFSRLLNCFLHRFQCVVGGIHGALHHCNSSFGTCGCVFGSAVNQAGKFLLGVSSLAFGSLGELSARSGSDVVQVTAVSSSLFSQRLEQAGLQSQQFLSVFHAQQGLCVASGFRQGSFGSGQVQFNQLFNAFESLVGQAKQGFDIGFVGSNNLF